MAPPPAMYQELWESGQLDLKLGESDIPLMVHDRRIDAQLHRVVQVDRRHAVARHRHGIERAVHAAVAQHRFAFQNLQPRQIAARDGECVRAVGVDR